MGSYAASARPGSVRAERHDTLRGIQVPPAFAWAGDDAVIPRAEGTVFRVHEDVA
jgi:hypothetical protein